MSKLSKLDGRIKVQRNGMIYSQQTWRTHTRNTQNAKEKAKKRKEKRNVDEIISSNSKTSKKQAKNNLWYPCHKLWCPSKLFFIKIHYIKFYFQHFLGYPFFSRSTTSYFCPLFWQKITKIHFFLSKSIFSKCVNTFILIPGACIIYIINTIFP